ncbi:hypothetical protein, partial [Escherichia coli]|uniref:hypothetical protein n=1 Tax=Escherichia coli TaxID=562 RepID=UPI001F2C3DAF
QKKLIMLPSETMIWQPEFTDKTLSRKPGAVHIDVSTGLNTAMETVVKRVNSRSDWRIPINDRKYAKS